MLLNALHRLGIRGELAPPRRASGVDAGACFAAPAGGEITVQGRKLVGSAQLRAGEALLQHGSVLLAGRQSTVLELTVGGQSTDGSASLTGCGGRPADVGEVAEAVARAARERWGGKWERSGVPDQVLVSAARHEARFRSVEWTWKA